MPLGRALRDNKRMKYTIAAFYRFLPLADPAALRDELLANFREADECIQERARKQAEREARKRAKHGSPQSSEGAVLAPETQAVAQIPSEPDSRSQLCGSLLITPEGINGTLAGPADSDAIDRLLTLLGERTGLPRAEVKFSSSDACPFGRLKLLLRAEVIPFRHAHVDPARPGTYVEPGQWNDLIADPNLLLLDTRNQYEVELGTFAHAIDPHIDTFSDFATYVREHLDPARTPKVAMFCTGGIRCEKASAFMLQEGFEEVYHLKGGILRYLEEVPESSSQWTGSCFVFDRRTAISHTDFKP